MFNLKKSIVSLALAGCIGFSLVACSRTQQVYVDNGNNQQQTTIPYTFVSDKYFVKSGVTDYVIVVPAECSDEITTAAQELKSFFSEATGANPQIYGDDEALPTGAKYFSLGETTYAEENVVGGNGGVANQGYRLVTVGDNLYILGNGDHGVVYGVYDLLGFMFDYEFFREDIYRLNTGVSTLNFFTIDYKDAPDITYRVGYSALSEYNHGINAMRYRLRSEWEIVEGGIGKSNAIHNSLTVLDPALYNNSEDTENYHPKWYTPAVDQLCYTAGGDETERQAMIDTAVAQFMKYLVVNTTKTYVYFQMSDTMTWCSCAACKESKEKYNAQSAAMLQVCQGIHEGIVEQLSEMGDDRNIKVVPLLYHETENVPVVKDEATGEYKLSDPNLNFDGVTPMWANLSVKSHAYAWDDPINAVALDMLDQMNCAFEEFWVWDYGIDFKEYFLPYNVYNNLSGDFKLLEKYNIGLHLYQCDHTAFNSTGFGALKLYLISKLTWDADQDVEKLTDDFFKAVYGDGSVAMREIYDQYRVLATYNSVAHGETPAWNQSVYSTTMIKKEYYPKGVVKEWLELLDESMASIEYLKAIDEIAYNEYKFNIESEGIFVRYIYAMLYMTGTDSESINFKIDLYNDVNTLGFGQFRESADSSLWPLAVTLGIDAYLQ